MPLTLDDLAREACCPWHGCEHPSYCQARFTHEAHASAIIRRLLTEPPSEAMVCAGDAEIDQDGEPEDIWRKMAAARLKELGL